MKQAFETVLGPVEWESDEQGFVVAFHRRTTRARWSEVTAAGLVAAGVAPQSLPVPQAAFSAVWSYLPGFNRVMQINETLAAHYRILVLARGPATTRAIRLPIPVADEAVQTIANEVRTRVRNRWSGEIPLGNSYTALGQVRPWWSLPLTILLTLTFGLLILLACAGFAALEAKLKGESVDLPHEAWIAMGIGMALWLLLIGGIVLAYRRIWWWR